MLNNYRNLKITLFKNHIFKFFKILYDLKQAPWAWYERLNLFLISKIFMIGKIDTTLFIKHFNNNFFVVQIYIDDIIFDTSNEMLYKEFAKLIQDEFEMSMVGKLNYFLRLQIKQIHDKIFLSQTKYTRKLIK